MMKKDEFIKKFNLKAKENNLIIDDCDLDIEIFYYDPIEELLILFHYGYYLLEITKPPAKCVLYCINNFQRSITPF
jgi:hypothetical protein